jgi:hypothetical protein
MKNQGTIGRATPFVIHRSEENPFVQLHDRSILKISKKKKKKNIKNKKKKFSRVAIKTSRFR